jgi:1-pyrroline-5-carboxylate dehydrogenase
MRDMRMGDVQDFRTFVGAVIDERSFRKISGYLDDARANATIVQGGRVDGARGYFVEPTLVETSDPAYRLLCEEIFGPVVTAYAYPDAEWNETLALVDRTSPYALTGAVFSRATSTSTTSRPVPSSASSRSAVPEPLAPTTKPDRS